jgi:DeoR family suf operon transcriptional repressor
MEVQTPGLAGQKGSRQQILLELKKDQPLVSAELAKRLGVSGTAVRRHMKELETEGLVRYGREQRGHGAPTFAYTMTSDGEALFPNRYQETATQLLEHLVQKEGKAAAVAVLEQQYEGIVDSVSGRMEGLGPDERLTELAHAMEKAGFMAETVNAGHETQLLIRNCAIQAMASCLPEICDAEQNLIQKLVGATVERKTHIVSGCNACEYVVSISDNSDNNDVSGEN